MKYEEKDFYVLAQAYCSKENEHKVLDPILLKEANAIAVRVANEKLARSIRDGSFFDDALILGLTIAQISELKDFYMVQTAKDPLNL